MFTLGRKIDIHYNTNRLILIIAALVSILAGFISKDFITGLKIGGSVFLSWALSRELDPKREYAAFLAVVFSLIILFVDFKVDLMAVFFILLILRFVSNITGKPSTILDILSLFILGAFLSFNLKNDVYIFMFILSLIFKDDFKENKKLYTIFFILSTSIYLYVSALFISSNSFTLSFSMSKLDIFQIFTIIGYFLFIVFDKDKSSKNDKGKKVDSKKIFSGQILFGIFLALLFLFTDITIGNKIIYLSSTLGVVLYGLAQKIFKF